MLQKLREDHHLSRQALAQTLGLSPGYVLKAEQCVFPSPPAPLIEYWHTKEHLDRDFLKQAYYDQQARKRRDWLNSWVPDQSNIRLTLMEPRDQRLSGFCSLWVNKFSSNYHPSQYAVSSGLCVPASAVYFAEKHPSKPIASSIIAAVDDLIQYARSGEWHAQFSMDDSDDIDNHINNLINLKEVISDHKHAGVSA
jgi:transcriptional regulator with XRE-family HTH domain